MCNNYFPETRSTETIEFDTSVRKCKRHWFLTLREEDNGFCVNCILRILLGLQMWVATRGWRKMHNDKLHDLN
jgi:hypothetical protein